VRALVTGGGGQLASDLQELLGDDAVSLSHAQLDVANGYALARAIEDAQPDVVINCAAFHNLDVCEAEPDQAWAVNVRAVREMAQRAPRLVHLSTNYVFDGRRDEPYAEHDLPGPRSVYAITKLAGEHAALAYAADALVVRTGGLYGEHGSASKGGNFVVRMITRARETNALRMVADQRLSPTATADLAAALVQASDRGVGGLLHLTNAGACSWYEFTVAIMEEAGIEVPIEAVTTSGGGADRPLNGVLSCARAEAAGLGPLPHWRDALRRYLAATEQLAATA
jgi:dTDP-4-dehydrorhamnose reductase